MVAFRQHYGSSSSGEWAAYVLAPGPEPKLVEFALLRVDGRICVVEQTDEGEHSAGVYVTALTAKAAMNIVREVILRRRVAVSLPQLLHS